MFKYEIDHQEGIVLLVATGFMSIAEVDDMNSQLFTFIDEARQRFGLIKMLTDARDSSVQTAEVSARFIIPTSVMKDPLDRYAVVLGSTLHKLQSERAFNDARAKAFLSIEDAKAWLRADLI